MEARVPVHSYTEYSNMQNSHVKPFLFVLPRLSFIVCLWNLFKLLIFQQRPPHPPYCSFTLLNNYWTVQETKIRSPPALCEKKHESSSLSFFHSTLQLFALCDVFTPPALAVRYVLATCCRGPSVTYFPYIANPDGLNPLPRQLWVSEACPLVLFAGWHTHCVA